jgi:hypothetical protein
MNKYKLDIDNIINIESDLETIKLNELKSIEENSIEELYLGNALELVDEIDSFLELVKSKLRLIGKIFILGTNLDIATEDYLDERISIQTFNKILMNKKRLFNIDSILESLNKNKIDYQSVQTENIYYYIVGKRQNK